MSLPANTPHQFPLALRLRRTPMACSNYRRRKIKCRPPDENAIAEQEKVVGSGPTAERAAPRSSSHRGPRATAPPLPYTGPPPVDQNPRFAGRQVPDLSLPTAHGGYPSSDGLSWNEGRIHAEYGGAGWTSPMPVALPASGTVASAQGRTLSHQRCQPVEALSLRGNPAFGPPVAYNTSSTVSAQQDQLNREFWAAHGIGNYAADYPAAEFFDPAYISGGAWDHGPSEAKRNGHHRRRS
ncbi:hypothetical protein FB451DRAFT_1478843 [Mycena latifolia]|nr:hypothetical protein FB451DRAFT_1478843 [Mycena latifolia]